MMKHAMALVALALVVEACAAPSTPAPAPTSTRTPAPPPSDTPTAASTVTMSPSRTPFPTWTPSSTPLPIPTLSFHFYPSQTASPGPTPSPLQCIVQTQRPADGAYFKPKEHFDINWKVLNTGTDGWDPGSVELVYVAGTRTAMSLAIRLEAPADPGEMAGLVAELVAPKNPGTYSTIWSLRRGKDYFCRVGLKFYVQ